MWNERYNDKIKAEGVSAQNYDLLKVDKGTIIHATRDFKPLNLKEVLEENKIETPDRYISPNPQIGGWNKFVKTNVKILFNVLFNYLATYLNNIIMFPTK